MSACSAAEGFVGAMCGLFVPTESVGARTEALKATLESRFPFSLVSDLGGFFQGGTGTADPLPDMLGGWMPLAFGEFGAFFATVKLVVTALMVLAFTWWVIDRLTPQVTI